MTRSLTPAYNASGALNVSGNQYIGVDSRGYSLYDDDNAVDVFGHGADAPNKDWSGFRNDTGSVIGCDVSGGTLEIALPNSRSVVGATVMIYDATGDCDGTNKINISSGDDVRDRINGEFGAIQLTSAYACVVLWATVREMPVNKRVQSTGRTFGWWCGWPSAGALADIGLAI